MKKLLCFLLLLSLSACKSVYLSPEEHELISQLKQADQYEQVKDPKLARNLGFVLGMGSYYVDKPGRGFLDTLIWPLSMYWDPYLSRNDAYKINIERSVYLAKKNELYELSKLGLKLRKKEINQEEYKQMKQAIEEKYTYSYDFESPDKLPPVLNYLAHPLNRIRPNP